MGHCKKERPICTYCGLIGHIAEKCYKLHGYPPRYKPKSENNVMANQVSGNFGNLDVLAASNTHQINGGSFCLSAYFCNFYCSILCLIVKWGRSLGHTPRHNANFFHSHTYWSFVCSFLQFQFDFLLPSLPRIFIVALFFLGIVILSRTLLNRARLVL